MINIFILFFLFLIPGYLYSKSLEIYGLEKLSKNDLQTLTSIDLNDQDISLQEVNIIINDLYSSDIIYDLNLEEDISTFKLIVEENKLIQNVFINNNTWVEDDLILEIIGSKTNSFILKSTIKIDLNNIKTIYKSKGFNEVSVVAKLEPFSKDRVNLIFDIYEGEQSKLNNIKFIGNKFFSSRFLSSKITSQDLNFYNIFKSGSNLNPDIFNFDINKLKNQYLDKGFFDVKITYSLEKGSFGLYTLIFYIEEGSRYKINDLNYTDKIKNNNFIKSILTNLEKDINKNNNFYDQLLINDYLEQVNLSLLRSNINDYYISANNSKDNSSINIFFNDIKQEPRVVSSINIYGNGITKDQTIRSKILIEPGDYINTYLLESSSTNLNKFPYIKNVNYLIEDFDQKSDLSFTIEEEKKTGNILFAGTFNSDTELGFMFGVEDKNFFGSGNTIDANFNINTENIKYDLNYTQFPLSNPYLSNTYSLFNQDNDYTSSFGYKSLSQGFGYSLNFSDNSQTSYSIGFSYEFLKGYDAKDSSILAINDNIGEFQNIVLKGSAQNDNTNDIFNPTDGHYNKLSFVLSPSEISDDPFYKLIFTNKNYFNLKNSQNYIFFNNNLGYAESLNSKLKTVNSFSLGGNNFKGFDFRGIGPVSDSIYLGGNKIITTTVGYGSSFIFDDKDNINIKLFLSAGSIWDSDYTSDNDFDLRSSYGLSLDFITAIGPISFSYASPINKKTSDKERNFAFTIGSSF